jgi:hypothetical protein
VSVDRLFYGSLALAALGIILTLITGNHTLAAYIVGSGLGGAAATRLLEKKREAFSVEEMVSTVRAAERSAFNEGVRFALEWEEHYVRGAEPITPDHEFGSHTLTLKPRPIRKKLSASNPERRLRAMQAHGRKRVFGTVDV